MTDRATVLFQSGLTTAAWVSIACSLKDLLQRLSTLPAHSDYRHQAVFKRLVDHRELSRAPVPKK